MVAKMLELPCCPRTRPFRWTQSTEVVSSCAEAEEKIAPVVSTELFSVYCTCVLDTDHRWRCCIRSIAQLTTAVLSPAPYCTAVCAPAGMCCTDRDVFEWPNEFSGRWNKTDGTCSLDRRTIAELPRCICPPAVDLASCSECTTVFPRACGYRSQIHECGISYFDGHCMESVDCCSITQLAVRIASPAPTCGCTGNRARILFATADPGYSRQKTRCGTDLHRASVCCCRGTRRSMGLVPPAPDRAVLQNRTGVVIARTYRLNVGQCCPCRRTDSDGVS